VVRLHSTPRVNYSEQYRVSFQTGKLRFQIHVKRGYNGSIGLRQKLELPGFLLSTPIVQPPSPDLRKTLKHYKQRNIAYDNNIQMLTALSFRLKTNSTSTSL
jgi:hypothetical protein